MRQINRRKPNKSLVTRIHERDPGKLRNTPNCRYQHLKYHLQLKPKGEVGDRGLGPQRGRQFTWRWKSRCLVNKCVLGPCRDNGTQRGILTDIAGLLPVHTLSLYYCRPLNNAGGRGADALHSAESLYGLQSALPFCVSSVSTVLHPQIQSATGDAIL